MAEAKFYYDQLMNEDQTTFSVYWYKDNTTENRVDRVPQIGDTKNGGNISEILRGVISQNASMGTQVTWNGSPMNLTSAWANIATSLKNVSRNLYNAANNVDNALKKVEGMNGGVLNWDQNAYYSINEFQKTFGGITTSTPLAISSIILPYIDSSGKYWDVKSQLRIFLGCIYPNEDTSESDVLEKSMEVESTEDKKPKGLLEWLVGGAVGLLSGGLKWAAGLTSRLTEDVFKDTSKYVLKLQPPHGYSGVPIDFVDNQWMANTLAIRIGTRQLFNLLISTVNVTISKELTYYKDELSPNQAQVDLTFQPVTVLKPTEIKEYVLSDMDAGIRSEK